jgi:DNA-binding FrmR family transcriptional regulator
VDINEKEHKEITYRLRRVHGQIDGVIRVIDSGRSCRRVVTANTRPAAT